MKLLAVLISIFFLFILASFFPFYTHAQTSPPTEKKIEAIVTSVKEEKTMRDESGKERLYQKLEITATNTDLKGKKFIVENGAIPTVSQQIYEADDKIVVTMTKNANGNDVFYITDYVRRGSLTSLFVLFIALVLIVGRLRGLTSLLGMGVSFLVIFFFILPQILAGADPVFITILASFFIIPVTFYLSHGVNKKTTSAVLGTVISLIITGLLADAFVSAAKLTGFSSDEANFLESAMQGSINIKGLLLSGIIIGSLGILDDITISQAAIVAQLKVATKNIPFRELYFRTMDIGRDHIASVVNTLVLVYTGAALPLLLLFVNNPLPFSEVINYEIIAEEIVRTLVASIGLILAVPITTFISSVFIDLAGSSKKE